MSQINKKQQNALNKLFFLKNNIHVVKLIINIVDYLDNKVSIHIQFIRQNKLTRHMYINPDNTIRVYKPFKRSNTSIFTHYYQINY